MIPTMQVFQAARVNAIMRGLQDIRQIPQDLKFLNRESVVPAVDGEIMARDIDMVTVADIIADDSEAVTYDEGKFQFESNAIPNIKMGRNVNQSKLNELNLLNKLGNFEGEDGNIFKQWEMRLQEKNLLGIRQRMEQLLVARACDSNVYNRLGIQISGSWGMPADLKVAVGTAWDTSGSATPVTDIQTVQLGAQIRYGVLYNRMTMSTPAFRYMIATTEWQTKAKPFIPQTLSFANLQLLNIKEMKVLAEAVLGLTIELYDARYMSQAADGSRTWTPYMPITKVILDNTDSDNNPGVQDFANGITTESIVSGIVPTGMVGQLPGMSYGPIGYVTAKADLNPPGVTYWGVARGFPRKHVLQANACLTVGAFSDQISTATPFIGQ